LSGAGQSTNYANPLANGVTGKEHACESGWSKHARLKMPTFVFVKELGWAHDGDKPVFCRLVTFRDETLTIPGGSLIAGQHYEEFDGIEYFGVFKSMPRKLKREVRAALSKNDRIERKIRDSDISVSRLAYVPVSVEKIDGICHVIASSETCAKVGAYKAGIRVKKDFGYAGPGGGPDDGGFHGMYWSQLREFQQRQAKPVEA
jgi:hypothetical protein